MARLKEVVVDCDVPSAMARFWSQVLDGYEILPYDDAEIARLAAELRQAVRREDYERAALLRDQLRALAAENEG